MSPKRQAQLELLLIPMAGPVSRPPGLWEEVDALPEKAAQYHRKRRKLVRPKLRQADLLEPPQGEDS
jgi:hypothetical protein